ncbi:peptide chain release factor N(5)-glutamine methyltransferase [Janibacter alittae]|uniref:Release factor glutamine methyltransferase n=1 Tax=Janibacter alittae TaxID=3115209 RepID=A0ABZ2MJM2_9MICO
MTSLRAEVDQAAAALAKAHVPSPRSDAMLLAAHATGADRSELERRMLLGGEVEPDQVRRLRALVAERTTRVPLQHLTGTAPFRRLELQVGPGVFVPRPETEAVADLALTELIAPAGSDGTAMPVVVDLCTGSGALALAIADEVPGAHVTAVEVDDLALAWAARNIELTGLPVDLIAADATAPPADVPALAGLIGSVDVVVSNPPYIPVGMVPLEPEVAEHDPSVALYGGSEDGLAIPLAVAATAATLLRPGGLLVMEHADGQGESLPCALRTAGAWAEVADHPDLAGRPRAAVARRVG